MARRLTQGAERHGPAGRQSPAQHAQPSYDDDTGSPAQAQAAGLSLASSASRLFEQHILSWDTAKFSNGLKPASSHQAHGPTCPKKGTCHSARLGSD